ncbi:MAG: hypothetical protein PHE86_01890 [Candidatus Marinimicrobia bacterium]|nr:hypothetical protein [Candidatus Neomarinimicrobiota bacterium]
MGNRIYTLGTFLRRIYSVGTYSRFEWNDCSLFGLYDFVRVFQNHEGARSLFEEGINTLEKILPESMIRDIGQDIICSGQTGIFLLILQPSDINASTLLNSMCFID